MTSRGQQSWANDTKAYFLEADKPLNNITLSGSPLLVLTNSGGELYGNGTPIDQTSNWSLFYTLSNEILFDPCHTLRVIGNDLYFDNELLARAGDISNVADWYLYPALSNVELDTSVGILFDGSLLTKTASGLSYNGQLLGANWSSFPALSNVSMGVYGINFSGGLLNSSGSSLFFNGSNYSPSQWSVYPALQNVTMSGYILFDTLAVEFRDTAPSLLNSASGVLFYNAQPIYTGTSGDVSQWANFPAVNNITAGSNPLYIGDGNNSLIVSNSAVQMDSESFVDIFIDRLADVNNGRFRVLASNGTGGEITMVADSDFTDNIGGFVDIKALSAGSLAPTAPSRVNVEAATLTLTAGAVGAPAFVPGSVNILSGAGTGVQILTATGVINIAGGTTTTLAGGAGVFLDGGVNDVNVASNQTLFVNTISPNGNALVEVTNGIGTNFIAGVTTSYCAIPYIAALNVIPVSPATSVDIPALNIISPSGSIVFGTSGQSITADAPAVSFRPSQDIYVAKNGSDTTGNGGVLRPYQTITKALTERALLSSSVEVTINLDSGTYVESIIIPQNTYVIGVPSGETRQPTNITGTITFTATGQAGLSFITLSGKLEHIGAGGVVSVFNCLITGSSADLTIFLNGASAQLLVSECRVTSGAGDQVGILVDDGVLAMRDVIQNHNGIASAIVFSGGASSSIRQCNILSLSSANNVDSIIRFLNSATHNAEITFSKLQYNVNTTDVVGSKCCIQFNNSGTINAQIVQNLLLCPGAITGSPNVEAIQKIGAGAVNFTYGDLQCSSTAQYISPAINDTALIPVQQGAYASFSSSATQVVAGANVVTGITHNTTEVNTRYYSLTGGNIRVLRSGLYEIATNIQLDKSGGGTSVCAFWFQTSPDNTTWTDVDRSASEITIQGTTGECLAVISLLLNVPANDYIRVVFASADATMAATARAAQAAPFVRPAVPSIITNLKMLN
jgi:hypothetical protein